MMDYLMAIGFIVVGGAFVWFCMYMEKREKLPPPSCIDKPTEAKTSRLAGLTGGRRVQASKLSSGGSGDGMDVHGHDGGHDGGDGGVG